MHIQCIQTADWMPMFPLQVLKKSVHFSNRLNAALKLVFNEHFPHHTQCESYVDDSYLKFREDESFSKMFGSL